MGAGGPQGSGRTNAGGHKRSHRSAPRVVHGGGPYGGGSTPSPRRRQQTSRAVARTPVKRYVRPKQRVSSHTKEHVKPQRKRITEDSPRFNAKTMGNKSGKQGGKLYLHGKVIHPKFPITNLREFYSNVLGNSERSFKNRVTNPKSGGRISNGLRQKDTESYKVGGAVGHVYNYNPRVFEYGKDPFKKDKPPKPKKRKNPLGGGKPRLPDGYRRS